MVAQPQQRRRVGVLTGNIVTVRMNGGLVGVVQNIGFQEGYGHQPVTGLGRVNPYEHAPGAARFSLSADFFRLRATIINEDLVALGARNLEDSGIIPRVAQEILQGLVFDIQVLSLEPNSPPLWTWKDCSYDGGSVNLRKHDIVGQSCQFLAIDRVYGQ